MYIFVYVYVELLVPACGVNIGQIYSSLGKIRIGCIFDLGKLRVGVFWFYGFRINPMGLERLSVVFFLSKLKTLYIRCLKLFIFNEKAFGL